MDKRVSLITLGVSDLPGAVAFYKALGWQPDNHGEAEDVAFFPVPGIIFALWHRDELAEDSAVSDPGGWGGVTLAYNTTTPEDVDVGIAEAEAARATISRRPGGAFYRRYSGVFVDPDGHSWEVAYNPRWTVTADGET